MPSPSPRTYVLVHGAYHGAWCWKPLAALLRAAGHVVYTPTQTGLGERSHLIGSNPSLETFVEDVAQVLRFEELEDVILVGHSFAGATIEGVADRMPERLRHLVFLDAQILLDGEAPAANPAPEVIERYKRRSFDAGDGVMAVRPAEAAFFGITDPAQGRWLETLLTPHPLRTYFDAMVLRNPLCNGVPATYIACTAPAFANTAKSRERARSLPGWRYLEIASAHDAMLLHPEELARLLEGIA